MKQSHRTLHIVSASFIALTALIMLVLCFAVSFILTYPQYADGVPFTAGFADFVTWVMQNLNVSVFAVASVTMLLPAAAFVASSAMLFSKYQKREAKYIAAIILYWVFALYFEKVCQAVAYFTADTAWFIAVGNVRIGLFDCLGAVGICLTAASVVLFAKTSGGRRRIDADIPQETRQAEVNDSSVIMYEPKTVTVAEITENTYGGTEDMSQLDPVTIRQLERIRRLYEKKVITEYEYRQLTLKFLNKD
ncbi:MAG: hypothetical protein NC350_00825 [Corallococcus sp.]|nr:hypothetical protein [Corallococcus sp.]